MTDPDIGFPEANSDDQELLLAWLGYLRGAVLRKAEGIDEAQADWRLDGRLISIKGVLNHLTRVEWRWIDGGMFGEEVTREEAEFRPGPELSIEAALTTYRKRGEVTDAAVRAMSLTAPCCGWGGQGEDLRWVLLHLINETARHAGHVDATRELLDGTTGE
ncbi:MAG: DUF664 domain-containing protein [Acidimicrobiales bacterium]